LCLVVDEPELDDFEVELLLELLAVDDVNT
jgi:hypothetical protein